MLASSSRIGFHPAQLSPPPITQPLLRVRAAINISFNFIAHLMRFDCVLCRVQSGPTARIPSPLEIQANRPCDEGQARDNPPAKLA